MQSPLSELEFVPTEGRTYTYQPTSRLPATDYITQDLLDAPPYPDMKGERFTLRCYGHYYLVPLNRLDAWEDWCSLEPHDPRSFAPPAEFRRVDPNELTFSWPEEG